MDQQVIEALSDENWELRYSALLEIGSWASGVPAKTLISLVETDESLPVRVLACFIVGDGTFVGREKFNAWISELPDKICQVVCKWATYTELTDEDISILKETLNNEALARINAIILGERQDPDVLTIVQKGMKHKSKFLRELSARTLLEYEIESALDILIEGLESDILEVKESAIQAFVFVPGSNLTEVISKDTVKSLYPLIRDENKDVREQVAQALGSFLMHYDDNGEGDRNELVEYLVSMLADPSPNVLASAQDSLSSRKISTIRKQFEDKFTEAQEYWKTIKSK